MATKIIQHAGYTISATSWENDGDYYQTNSITVPTKEEAQAYVNLISLCKSVHYGGIGNSCDLNDSHYVRIEEVIRENLILFKDEDLSEFDEDNFRELFSETVYDLLGSSEFYAYRVLDSYDVTYSAVDLACELIDM